MAIAPAYATTDPPLASTTDVADDDLADALRAALAPAAVEAGLVAGVLPDLPESARAVAMTLAAEQSRSTLAIVADVVVAYDLRYALACRYVEFKARWLQLSTRMAYTTIVSGSPDPAVAAEAATTSLMMSRIEPFLRAGHLRQINDATVPQRP